MRRGRKKALYRTERDSLEGSHEEAEIQRKTLRRGKILAFSEDTCLEKEKTRSKVTPRKVGMGLKRRRELSKRTLGWRLAWLVWLKWRRPHICSDWEEDISTQTSAPIETEPFVWPSPPQGQKGRRTKWPGCQPDGRSWRSSWRKKTEKQENH